MKGLLPLIGLLIIGCSSDNIMSPEQDCSDCELEIYSDLSKPLLTEYSFFNGLTGGILTYSAIIEFESINSKLDESNKFAKFFKASNKV